jgi:type II secretory pathway component PulF
MEQEILKKIEEQDQKINAIYESVEKTRKYILMVTIATIVAFVLPLIGLLFLIPSFISTYTGLFGGI